MWRTDTGSRLLTSADGRTALPGLMLIQNCIDQSSPRSYVQISASVLIPDSHCIRKLLVRSLVGARLCISLLDKMANTYEAEEGTEDANAFDVGQVPVHPRIKLDFLSSFTLPVTQYSLDYLRQGSFQNYTANSPCESSDSNRCGGTNCIQR